MLYQKILTEEHPYQLMLGRVGAFTEHRHADLELNFCVSGSFDVIVNKELHHVSEGEVSMIAPNAAHAYPSSSNANCTVLTVILGTSFLKKHFKHFASGSFAHPVCRLKDTPEKAPLLHALQSMVALYAAQDEKSELLLTAELYRVCAYLLDEMMAPSEKATQADQSMARVANIEKALELIYYDYHRTLTVQEAALVTGYGKSNFCKIFKQITGVTFHRALNHRRICVACGLLTSTALCISQISSEIGFAQPKDFCRVFKEELGISPGAYRKAH